MESMTGYAFLEKSNEQFSYSVEIKSLNSRYLEVNVNLPKMLKNEEFELIEFLKKHFTRGKIECTIDIQDWAASRRITINAEMLKNYYTECKKVCTAQKIDIPLSFDALISLDGVINRERTVLQKKSRDDIYASVLQAVQATIGMRKNEAKIIKKDFLKSLASIVLAYKKIGKLSADVSKKQYQRIADRLAALAPAPIASDRLYAEVAILADKMDINEELVRLRDHFEKFKAVINTEEQAGKMLDFIAQEMFREINTIASKSNNSEIAHLVVSVKNEIERIREHCRNIV